MADYLCDHIV